MLKQLNINRMFVLILALLLCAGLITGCGDKKTVNSDKLSSGKQSEENNDDSESDSHTVPEDETPPQQYTGYGVFVQNDYRDSDFAYNGKALTQQGEIVPTILNNIGSYAGVEKCLGVVLNINNGNASLIENTSYFDQNPILDPNLLTKDGIKYTISNDVMCVAMDDDRVMKLVTLDDLKSTEFSENFFFGYIVGTEIVAITTDFGERMNSDSFRSWLDVSGKDMPQGELINADAVGYISGEPTIRAGDNASAFDIPVSLANGTEMSLDILLNNLTCDIGQIIYAYSETDDGGNRWNTGEGGSSNTAFSVQGGNMADDALDAIAIPETLIVELDDIEKIGSGYGVKPYSTSEKYYEIPTDVFCLNEKSDNGIQGLYGQYEVCSLEDFLNPKVKPQYEHSVFVYTSGYKVIALKGEYDY